MNVEAFECCARGRYVGRARFVARLAELQTSNPYMEESAKALSSALNSLREPLYGVSMSTEVSFACVRASRARATYEGCNVH